MEVALSRALKDGQDRDGSQKSPKPMPEVKRRPEGTCQAGRAELWPGLQKKVGPWGGDAAGGRLPVSPGLGPPQVGNS